MRGELRSESCAHRTARSAAWVVACVALTGLGCGDDGGGAPAPDGSVDAASGSDIGGTDVAGPGAIPLVDPACLDGLYSEALPPVDADIAELRASYDAASYQQFVIDLLEARYPTGAHLVARGVAEDQRLNCLEAFAQGATASDAQLGRRVSTIVHECGHFLDIARGDFGENVYVIRPDLSITCEGGDARERFGNTFARSEITKDSYDALLPDDFYKDTYLVGSGSNQGFNMLAEEVTQYINSLATDWALRDFLGAGWSITARDGILTFLWYMQRYLRLARTTDPDVHDFLLGDACWRELILTLWGRAWLYLDETEGLRSLGIEDAALLELVLDADLVEEIHRVRVAHGCL